MSERKNLTFDDCKMCPSYPCKLTSPMLMHYNPEAQQKYGENTICLIQCELRKNAIRVKHAPVIIDGAASKKVRISYDHPAVDGVPFNAKKSGGLFAFDVKCPCGSSHTHIVWEKQIPSLKKNHPGYKFRRITIREL
jgi:hypothetical protein